MAKLTIERADAAPVTLSEPDGILLADVLRRAAPSFLLPCGGRRSCGKCLIWAKGVLSKPGDEEKRLLALLTKHPPAGYHARLACFCSLVGDACMQLPQASGETAVQARGIPLPPACDGAPPGAYAVAGDVGTTTITMVAYRLYDGAALATAHQMNRQGAYGADVLSRIEYANAHGPGVLSQTLRMQLSDMLGDILAQGGITADKVERMVVTGNTTMLHFLAGLDPRSIGVSPFTPQSLFGESVLPKTVFPALGGSPAKLYLPSCISAYVGADITCGLLIFGFGDGKDTRLMVDVGTNGEMALSHQGRLLCCSTAAGPAFEGAQITMGMPATSGAVYRVRAREGAVQCETIDGAPPVGICGTGLISAIDCLLAAGVVDGSGRLLREGHRYAALTEQREDGPVVRLAGDVVIAQKDIRAVQLAKAAIAAGIETLLHHAGIAASDVQQLLMAGGFGSYIDPAEAGRIGLIPPELVSRTVAAGNTALAGAAAMAFSADMHRQAEALAAQATELPLSTDPFFMDAYIDRMPFYEGSYRKPLKMFSQAQGGREYSQDPT